MIMNDKFWCLWEVVVTLIDTDIDIDIVTCSSSATNNCGFRIWIIG
jgi:hypothetical protein